MDYKIKEISEGFYCITQDYVRCFLIVGKEEGLLIDTGVGGELVEFIKTITPLPIQVIITHGDPDHVGAVNQFKKRRMHPSEFDYYRMKNKHTVEMTPIWEGEVIEVGNYRLEVLLIPGHTPGSIALLERSKRFIIGGDSIQTGAIFMFGDGRNFDAFRGSMLKLQKDIELFDTIYASHNDLVVLPTTIDRLYTGAGKVMQGEVKAKEEVVRGNVLYRYEVDGVAFYYNQP